MSLVLLAHASSHLQNASRARLGLTSLPLTSQLHALLLQMQKFGLVSTVLVGGPTPPPPSSLAPTMSPNPSGARAEGTGHVAGWGPQGWGNGGYGLGNEGEEEEEEDGTVTQANIASRRLWVGLKYHNSIPVLERMRLVSKPTRRVWMPYADLDRLVKGERRGHVRGMRAVGEALYLTSDRGIMEVREAVERRIGGMLLCRVNGLREF